MEENRIVCGYLDMYREWKEIELCGLVCTYTENGRKQNCMCWFVHAQRMEGDRIVGVGLLMYGERKKTEFYVLFWTCTENGSKENCM